MSFQTLNVNFLVIFWIWTCQYFPAHPPNRSWFHFLNQALWDLSFQTLEVNFLVIFWIWTIQNFPVYHPNWNWFHLLDQLFWLRESRSPSHRRYPRWSTEFRGKLPGNIHCRKVKPTNEISHLWISWGYFYGGIDNRNLKPTNENSEKY